MQTDQWVHQQTGIPVRQCESTIQLLEDGATVPFIARYRKEKTGGLDEVDILSIMEGLNKWKELVKRKATILTAIQEQGQLTDSLKKEITNCWSITPLEDLYLPYKRKKTTKAEAARKLGLEGLAKIIMTQKSTNLQASAKPYISKAGNLDAALQGARDIIAEWVSENSKTRDIIRHHYQRFAEIKVSGRKKNIAGKPDEAQKYRDYFEHQEKLNRCPSHRLLAILRGEKEGFLSVSLQIDDERMIGQMQKFYIHSYGDSAQEIKTAIIDAYKRLITPSLTNEVLKAAKTKADVEAIEVFQNNLRALLLEAPLGEKATLAIDPGYRTGCKMVALDQKGDLLEYATIFPHAPQHATEEAASIVRGFIHKYHPEAIAIGNGTAGRETVSFFQQICTHENIAVYSVNEAGASIYSASAIARKELGHLDLTVRGAISIGRRLMDPLSELIKIDPKSIGVGQYQHDVDQKLLQEKLDQVVMSCVNHVGVNLNTASPSLLAYVSGIGKVTAEKIIDYRSRHGEFSRREELKAVKGLGSKTFEQAAGFLRIKEGSHPLDNSAVHPERYSLVSKMAKDLHCTIQDLLGNSSLIAQIPLNRYISDGVGLPTLLDIVKELKKPGLDPRGAAEYFTFADHIQSIDDVKVGDVLPGIVNNVTKFGAFVDIGIKESGLIHISQLADTYVSDPATIITVNQKVKARVIGVDTERKRISLSLKGKAAGV